MWIRKPLGIGLISITSVVLVMYANYQFKTKKLAELEYREDVRKAQQEIVDQYQESEDEIKDRYHKMVKWKEEVREQVNKEVDNAKSDTNTTSYIFTASDRNTSRMHD